ncbi:ATP-binding protein [Xanthocytophaga agilis]|uniref:histidine kinase n=1 Tax=Xanthocytophaga agilis TaxID=3048010 RepID=A0AAE3UG03_9BACT|nr:ATP-binding protein [Xanthocytophaga agilis]MDJ1501902.1 ATP-binding protein [Xanthocytophaga agilis]
MDIQQELESNEHLSSVPKDQIQWLTDHSELLTLEIGDYAFRKGDLVDKLFIVLKGRLRIFFMQGNQQIEFGYNEKGHIGGSLPYSRLQKANGNGVAVDPTLLLALHTDYFPEMIQTQYELTEMLVHLMIDRVRDFTKFQQQNEKMISLGKLSAGLAHELNNPASAVIRSSDALKKHLNSVPLKLKKVVSMQLTAEQVDQVNEVLFSKIKAGPRINISLMERTSLEDELTDWLEEHGLNNAYELAECFVDYDLTANDLDFINQKVSTSHLSSVLDWLCNVLTTEKMVNEIAEASTRISKLVKAIKEYSHMDGGTDKQKVNLREGIQSTLTILQHKLKTKNIEVKLDIPNDLPQININIGEMNQVWTNLIDNAIDAMEDHGQLHIKSFKDRNFIITKIVDNGIGIPEEIIGMIFDPFFTTKPVGKGTGLGLEIVQSIIKQHNGKIKVNSKPGQTEFNVCLPID